MPNGDAIRNGWPRVPIPSTHDELLASAQLGQTVADLLDVDTVDDGNRWADSLRRTVARITRLDGNPLDPPSGDLAVTAGWGFEQIRRQNSGAMSRAVMPGSGRVEIRDLTDAELESLTSDHLDLLGLEVLDVYLNDEVCWRGVPQAAWDFKVGGFQVLRKWLSYRDKSVIGRDLTIAEVRQFSSICLRLTQLVLLKPQLDANYLAVVASAKPLPI
jgi:hypothetical protein